MTKLRNLRPAWVEVDLQAIAHNIKELKSITAPGCQFLAVVKADGYGHGAVQVSEVALKHGADYLAVAILDEARTLREHGIQAPILILGYTPEEQFGELIDLGITQTIYRTDMAQKLANAAKKKGQTAKVHIKIDTGMSRIGFPAEEESIQEIKKIVKMPGLDVEGIFTHFAVADEKNKSFTFEQLKSFNAFCDLLEFMGVPIRIRHASNSAGILDVPEANLDMVRAGISLYGLYPSTEVFRERIDLKPALSFKAKIAHVKTIPAGTTVSYGRRYESASEIKVATVPVGYADGYNRLLTNKGSVLINGQKVPVIGTVCMDQFMVDVTSIEQVKPGDEVVLIGQQGDQKVTADDIAELCGTISYEILCGLSSRVPRIYKKLHI